MSTIRSTHRPITRSTFLHSAVAITGGAAGLGGLATSAHASGAPGLRSAEQEGDIEIPAAWRDTVFREPQPDRSQGYVASLTPLFDGSPLTHLSVEELSRVNGIVHFENIVPGDESFSAQVDGGVTLNEGPTAILFTGDQGTEIQAEAQFVHGPDPVNPAVLLHVLGEGDWSIRLPDDVQLALARIPTTPDQASTEQARAGLEKGIADAYFDDADEILTQSRYVRTFDHGQHLSAHARYGSSGPFGFWFGTAIPCADEWGYLLGLISTE